MHHGPLGSRRRSSELRAWLLATHQVKASLGLMHKTLVRLGLTLKKVGARRGAGSAGHRRAARRMARQARQSEPRSARLCRRDRGRDQHGAPLWPQSVRPAPGWADPPWPLEGDHVRRRPLRPRLRRPYVLDGPMNGATFRAWTEQMLAPELRPGDIVIMDNLAAHKVAGIAKAITDRRRRAALSAALLARPQSDRAGLRQAQGALARGNCRAPSAPGWRVGTGQRCGSLHLAVDDVDATLILFSAPPAPRALFLSRRCFGRAGLASDRQIALGD